jgi:LacI family transcriptional regulator
VSGQREGRAVTRADVARRAGVSNAVVSYVLNNGPRGVAPETRERVLAAIEELRYRPNAVARALKVRRTETFGLLVPDNSNPFFAELARAVEDVAYRRGHALVLANSNNDLERERAQLDALLDRQVDGLLLISVASGGGVDAAAVGATPVVLLDRAPHGSSFSSVLVDNAAGAEAATRHLVEHHGLTVDCLAGPGDVTVAAAREAGWRRAMQRAGHDTAGRVHHTAFTRQGGHATMSDLIATGRTPAALFASSDLQAVGVLRAAHEAGLRVPEDLAVVAFDGTPESEYTHPPLTVVRQPIVTIAETAVALLLQAPARPASREIVPGELVLRTSCGCPPRTAPSGLP